MATAILLLLFGGCLGKHNPDLSGRFDRLETTLSGMNETLNMMNETLNMMNVGLPLPANSLVWLQAD